MISEKNYNSIEEILSYHKEGIKKSKEQIENRLDQTFCFDCKFFSMKKKSMPIGNKSKKKKSNWIICICEKNTNCKIIGPWTRKKNCGFESK